MENLEISDLFGGIYQNARVLITGHTGFKGSWLALWLKLLNAEVIGYSLEPPTQPNHFELLNLNIVSIKADINDYKKLESVLKQYQPKIIFHLAAQSLVRKSYFDPIETFETNVIGTLKVFEAAKNTESVKAIINVTSDKCYDNKETLQAYKETDRMGGYDPYSASKGCSELLTSSFRNSFYNVSEYGKSHAILLASVRAGNVIGGGDWAEDRLFPDIIRAVSNEEHVVLRNSASVRPWQHVLEPLSGYLLLGARLLHEDKECASAWNFGPQDENVKNVEEIVILSSNYWDKIKYKILNEIKTHHEAKFLKLDSSKATTLLKWENIWDMDKSIKKTIRWYKAFYENKQITTIFDLNDFISDAKSKKLIWTR